MPFAVVGSTRTYDVAGKQIRGRKYPWGIVDGWFYSRNIAIVNQLSLQSIMRRTVTSSSCAPCSSGESPWIALVLDLRRCSSHMQDLKEITEEHLYEVFRRFAVGCSLRSVVTRNHLPA